MKNDSLNYDNSYLEKEFEELYAEFKSYKKDTESFIDSSNHLLNSYFLDHEFNRPKFLLDHLQLMSIEALNFVKNVCEKHGISWWLDFGNLLGAFRHGKFIPWDEDMDIGMIREDYMHFESVISQEITSRGLNDFIEVKYNPSQSGVPKFIQVLIRGEVDINDFKYILGNVDIFPYEYIKGYDEKTLVKDYSNAKDKYIENRIKNFIPNFALDMFYEDLNLSWEPTDYVIPGWENPATPGDMYKLVVYKKDKIFPLKEIDFQGNIYPCPNDVDYYLKQLYSDYMRIPKSLRRHYRVNQFKRNTNNHEVFTECLTRIREINANFE